MVAPSPFISGTLAERINGLIKRGYATVQELQDPALTVTFARRTGTTWTDQLSDVTPISIALKNQQPEETQAETRGVGLLRVWAADVTDQSGDVVPQQEDRFLWEGAPCRVDVVHPVVRDVVVIEFTLLGVN